MLPQWKSQITHHEEKSKNVKIKELLSVNQEYHGQEKDGWYTGAGSTTHRPETFYD